MSQYINCDKAPPSLSLHFFSSFSNKMRLHYSRPYPLNQLTGKQSRSGGRHNCVNVFQQLVTEPEKSAQNPNKNPRTNGHLKVIESKAKD